MTTLKYAEALKAAGVPDVQAKAQAEALADALREGGRELVTKADLKVAITELKAEIQAMLNRQLLTLTGIIIGSMVAMTGIFAAISLQANGRYLDALAVVDDPTNAKRDLNRVTTPKKDAAGRGCSGFNPLARHDVELFQSIMAGEHCLRGFNNRDIRGQLESTVHLQACGQDPKKASAKVSRTFRRFHAHGLIAKVPRTRRWRVTLSGRRVMGTSLYLRDHHFPEAYSRIAA